LLTVRVGEHYFNYYYYYYYYYVTTVNLLVCGLLHCDLNK